MYDAVQYRNNNKNTIISIQYSVAILDKSRISLMSPYIGKTHKKKLFYSGRTIKGRGGGWGLNPLSTKIFFFIKG